MIKHNETTGADYENSVEFDGNFSNEGHVSLPTRLGTDLAGNHDIGAVCSAYVFSRTRSSSVDGRDVYAWRHNHGIDAPENGLDQTHRRRAPALVDTPVFYLQRFVDVRRIGELPDMADHCFRSRRHLPSD